MAQAGDELGRELAKLRREMDTMKAALRRRSLGLSSLDGATLTVKDNDGIRTGAVGTKTGDIVSDAMTARSANYDPDAGEGGLAGWLIDRDGNADFRDVNFRGVSSGVSASYQAISATDSLLYKGAELDDILWNRPKGIVAWGQVRPGRIGESGLWNTNGERGIMELTVPVESGRMYKVWTTPLTQSNAPAAAEFRIRYTSNGSQPTLTSSVLVQSFRGTQYQNSAVQGVFRAFEGVTQYRLLLSFFSAADWCDLYWQGDIGLCMVVEDMGPIVNPTGVLTSASSGGGNPTPKVRKTFDVQPYASRSYTAGGGLVNGNEYNNKYCMQGDIGIDGNRRSWMWFDANSQGLGSGGSMNDLQGVARADLEYFEVYLNYPHWYWGSGGMAFVGCHNSNVVTPTEQGGALYGRKQEWYPGRNIGKWVNLMDTDIMWEALAGRLEGIVLGNTGNATRDHYGYAWGANGVNGQQPGLRAAYWK